MHQVTGRQPSCIAFVTAMFLTLLGCSRSEDDKERRAPASSRGDAEAPGEIARGIAASHQQNPDGAMALLAEIDRAILEYASVVAAQNPFEAEAAAKKFEASLDDIRVRWSGVRLRASMTLDRFNGTSELWLFSAPAAAEAFPVARLLVGLPSGDSDEALMHCLFGGTAALMSAPDQTPTAYGWAQIGTEVPLERARTLRPGAQIETDIEIVDIYKIDADMDGPVAERLGIRDEPGLRLPALDQTSQAPGVADPIRSIAKAFMARTGTTQVVVFAKFSDSDRSFVPYPPTALLNDGRLTATQRSHLVRGMSAPVLRLRTALGTPGVQEPDIVPDEDPGLAVMEGVLRGSPEIVDKGLTSFWMKSGSALDKSIDSLSSASENYFQRRSKRGAAERLGHSTTEYREPVDILSDITQSGTGWDALHYAAALNSRECARQLASMYFWPGQRSGELRTPTESERTKLSAMRYELKADSVLSSKSADAFLTPLHLAAMFGHDAVLEELLPAALGKSLPKWAAARGYRSVTEIPSWVNIPDRWGFTPTDYAVMFRQPAAERMLRASGGAAVLTSGDLPSIESRKP